MLLSLLANLESQISSLRLFFLLLDDIHKRLWSLQMEESRFSLGEPSNPFNLAVTHQHFLAITHSSSVRPPIQKKPASRPPAQSNHDTRASFSDHDDDPE